jgi:hypothetical protein
LTTINVSADCIKKITRARDDPILNFVFTFHHLASLDFVYYDLSYELMLSNGPVLNSN